MGTAEQLAFSITEEPRAVHVLLWDDQDDLVRALLVLCAALEDHVPIHALLASTEEKGLAALRKVVESRSPVSEDPSANSASGDSPAKHLWILFVPQATSKQVGPWLNGWRRPLSEPPGTLLVIRHADFEPFQRNAPDLASYAGPRIYDASTMLSVFSEETHRRIRPTLPSKVEHILKQLPGNLPPREEITQWIAVNAAGPEKPAD